MASPPITTSATASTALLARVLQRARNANSSCRARDLISPRAPPPGLQRRVISFCAGSHCTAGTLSRGHPSTAALGRASHWLGPDGCAGLRIGVPVGARRLTMGKGGKREYRYEDIVKLVAAPSPARMLIDVRTPEEVAATGRIPGARNVSITAHPHAFHLPVDEFEAAFGFRLPEDRDRAEIVFYCKAGVRSKAAAGLAQEAGWKRVGEYGGSWVDWEGNGGAVERDSDDGGKAGS